MISSVGGGEPQIGKVSMFQTHVGLNNLAVITWNNVAQFIDIDYRH